MSHNDVIRISGMEEGERVRSRILEERIQRAVQDGARHLHIEADGQHGIGGRLWIAQQEPVHITIHGPVGQRVGAMGCDGTFIEVMGPGTEDAGWLNAGADILIHGNAGNGIANAMAQGRVRIAGSIGARGMTMTKHNPRFTMPELWVLGSVGDYFAEFMAGGTAVICGHAPQSPANVLGYRPCVGMVGGRILVRGPHDGFSQADARLAPIDDALWQWLEAGLMSFTSAINRPELLPALIRRNEWQCIVARSPHEKTGKPRLGMDAFRRDVWEKELGAGGLVGDLTSIDRSPVPVITTGELRRFVPVWENARHAAPCQSSCPTGIPVQRRWQLVRDGLVDEAVDLALAYTPFPATVCGYLCPHLCMDGCTRNLQRMKPVDVTVLGKAGAASAMPQLPRLTGTRVAVVGGGVAGISVAWQLRMQGIEAVIHDMDAELGGKVSSAIPESRIPRGVLEAELARVRKVLPHIHLSRRLTREEFEQLRADYDFVVLATGATAPRMLPVPGKELAQTALSFLRDAKAGKAHVGQRVVIIGAGNVGCDVATEAARLGATSITLMDIQKPAAFGKERDEAEAAGAVFRWPCFTRAITPQGVELTTGEILPADTVIFSIGDAPDLGYLPDNIATARGHVSVNELQQTTDARVFAIGDVVRPGLLTQAIGAGRKAADTIVAMAQGQRPVSDTRTVVDTSRIKLEYFDPRLDGSGTLQQCGEACASCGTCRDCGICEGICPQGAISRVDLGQGRFEMRADGGKCIGCGFCAGACPCGIWDLVENTPLD